MSPVHRPTTTVSSRPRWTFALLAAAGAAVAGLFAGCQRKPPPEPAEETSRRTVPKVTVVNPERNTVRRSIERPGYNVEAYQSTPLYAKIPGYVLKWNVDIGASVRKDQVLAVLDVPEMEVKLLDRKASVRQADAEVRQAKAAIEKARA